MARLGPIRTEMVLFLGSCLPSGEGERKSEGLPQLLGLRHGTHEIEQTAQIVNPRTPIVQLPCIGRHVTRLLCIDQITYGDQSAGVKIAASSVLKLPCRSAGSFPNRFGAGKCDRPVAFGCIPNASILDAYYTAKEEPEI